MSNANKTRLRVGSYNIRNGHDVGHDMSLLGAHIKSFDLDVVGLQEVDILTRRAKGLDTLKLLADAASYPYRYFARAIDFNGGQYGTAIMSRYPIVSEQTLTLPTPEGLEGRSLGYVTLDVNTLKVKFINTHLSYEKKEVREAQFDFLNETVASFDNFIITGDFNTVNDGEFAKIVGGIRVNGNKYPTFPGTHEGIDDIIVPSSFTVADSGMAENAGYSDHNLLWAELEL